MFIPAASRLKDVKWHSLTCPLGWAVQGTHAAQNDGSRVTAVDCPLASARPSLAVGDNFGRVRLLRYPCTSALAKSKAYRGHAAPVAAVRWTAGASHLVTVGARDRVILQWEHVVDDIAEEERAARAPRRRLTPPTRPRPSALPCPPAGDAAADVTAGNHADGRCPCGAGSDTLADTVGNDDEDDDDTEGSDDNSHNTGVDADPAEATSKQRLLACVPPTRRRAVLEPPDATLAVRWIHGCQAELSRGSCIQRCRQHNICVRSCVPYMRARHTRSGITLVTHASSQRLLPRHAAIVASGTATCTRAHLGCARRCNSGHATAASPRSNVGHRICA